MTNEWQSTACILCECNCGIVVQLDVHLPGLDAAVAQDLADTAHRDICPYSHATRNNVDVTIKLV